MFLVRYRISVQRNKWWIQTRLTSTPVNIFCCSFADLCALRVAIAVICYRVASEDVFVRSAVSGKTLYAWWKKHACIPTPSNSCLALINNSTSNTCMVTPGDRSRSSSKVLTKFAKSALSFRLKLKPIIYVHFTRLRERPSSRPRTGEGITDPHAFPPSV